MDVDANFFEVDEDHENYLKNDAQYQLYNSVTFNDELSVKLNLNSFSLNIIHLNIRSISKNYDNFIAHLASVDLEFDLVCLSETWNRKLDTNIYFPNYASYHVFRENRRGGGEGFQFFLIVC